MIALQLIDTDRGLPLELLTLAPKDVNEADDKKFIQIAVRRVSDHGTHTYIGVVPAGQYSISKFSGDEVRGQFYITRSIPVEPSFGTFRIEPGRLTNLGSAHYYAKPRARLYEHMMVRNGDFAGATSIIREDLTNLAQGIDNLDAPISWDEDGYVDERYDRYLSVVQNPLFLGRWQRLGTELVVLSSAGAMLRADRADNWASDFVESDYPLLMIDRNAGGNQVAITDGSGLFSKSSTSDTWEQIPVPDGADLIAIRIDSAGKIYVIDRQQTSLVVHESSSVADPDWTATMVYRQKTGWLAADADRAMQPVTEPKAQEERPEDGDPPRREKIRGVIRTVSARLIGDSLVVFEGGSTYVVDVQAKTATKLETPKKFEDIVEAGGMLVGVWKSMLSESDIPRYYWAEDLAGPWKAVKIEYDVCPGEARRAGRDIVCADDKTRKYKGIRFLGEPILAGNGKMYATMQMASTMSMAMFAPDAMLGVSENGGARWKMINDNSELLSRCRTILPGLSEDELIIACDSTDGKIYSFNLDTREYTLQREPADF